MININTTYENLLVDDLLLYSITIFKNIIKNVKSIKIILVSNLKIIFQKV